MRKMIILSLWGLTTVAACRDKEDSTGEVVEQIYVFFFSFPLLVFLSVFSLRSAVRLSIWRSGSGSLTSANFINRIDCSCCPFVLLGMLTGY